ncbi:glutathione S-transferase family protein [Sulfitobacter sp. D35]|uniref:glutathione S-transferase family protein n=1 Tax=Sulfitobacter sp. D35 TaxID=3083252 RepID=UPI00296F3E83|nr:glutathione S-transferase family protein [Sulfitobacter sp. D35]MDW4497555.1 glutathione S-transferase family protein [Sulfitobacter sp. D35]
MGIEISGFAWVPEFAQGYVKDLRPRWALAEAGLNYEVRQLENGETDGAEYRRWQPFGQVPAYRDDEVELFESGAILLHIGRKSDVLRPRGAQETAQTEAWMFAAFNSVEPRVDNLVNPQIFYPDEDWVAGWRPHALRLLEFRLTSLTGWLEGRDWLVARFGVADIAMATVLRGLREEPVIDDFPVVASYLERCLERPAFAEALRKQRESFRPEAA